MLAECFRGHGVFISDVKRTLSKFDDSAEKLAAAIRNMGMQHAWVHVHDGQCPVPVEETKDIIEGLAETGVHLAGWGYCPGHDPEGEARYAAEQLKQFGLVNYVADIEDDRTEKKFGTSHWEQRGVSKFFECFREHAPNAQVVVSSHGYIAAHRVEIMQEAAPYVDGVAPQVYWGRYPSGKLHPPVSAEAYPYDSAASYARLCIDTWRQYITEDKPLIVTGQAYWGEPPEFHRVDAEGKMRDFLDQFQQWNAIAALNWFHIGYPPAEQGFEVSSSMSSTMVEMLTGARVSEKLFAR